MRLLWISLLHSAPLPLSLLIYPGPLHTIIYTIWYTCPWRKTPASRRSSPDTSSFSWWNTWLSDTRPFLPCLLSPFTSWSYFFNSRFPWVLDWVHSLLLRRDCTSTSRTLFRHRDWRSKTTSISAIQFPPVQAACYWSILYPVHSRVPCTLKYFYNCSPYSFSLWVRRRSKPHCYLYWLRRYLTRHYRRRRIRRWKLHKSSRTT